MLASLQEAGGKQAVDVINVDRTVCNTIVADSDFNKRFEPAHAPRPVANNVDFHVVLFGGGSDSICDFVRA